jgi:hypothetical protein
MYNAFEPFVKLTNANLALFNRFANSSEMTRLVQDTISRSMNIPQESMTKASQTDAFSDWTQGLVDNATRFTQDYVNGFTQSMAMTQNFLSRQMEQGSRQLAQITEQAPEEADEAGQHAAKSAKGRGTRKSK